ncbi:hypothetical protein EI94DRAFT_1607946, partial [Lactarius quietus]
WSMYLTEAEKQDNDVTESWKGDTDGILIFTGLFSAVVAAFIIESYKNLSPNSADKANALLAQITQQLVNISNGTPLSNAIAQTNQPFKPTASAVRVNVLFFLSLVLSLTCALSATLMQQWARRYKELAQQTGAPHKRGVYGHAYSKASDASEWPEPSHNAPAPTRICLPLLRGSPRLPFPHLQDCFIHHPRLCRGVCSGIRHIDCFTQLVLKLPLCYTPVRNHLAPIPGDRDRGAKGRPRYREPTS